MDFSSQTPSMSNPTPSSRSMARSKACLHCRRRKMRCDGVRPACFQCIRADRASECEYGDGANKSGTQILYERLAVLEKRYRDLQASKRPKGNAGGTSSQTRGPRRGAQLSRSSSVPGHDRGNRNRHPQLPRRDQDYGDQTSGSRGKVARSAHSSPLSGSESPLSEVSEASFGLQSYGNSFPYGTPTMVGPSLSSSSNLPFGFSQETVNQLLDTFAVHAQQIGITLIMDCANLDLAHFPKPFTPLLFLWACHFSKDPQLQKRKPGFLDLVLDSLSGLLREPLGMQRGSNGDKEPVYNIFLAILLHTSLATYFFSQGRLLEGNYHSNNASQLAICAGLHRTANPRTFRVSAKRDSESSSSPGSPGAGLLPKPLTEKDAYARNQQFWNLFVVDRSWSAMSGSPSPSWRWGSSGLGFMNPEGLLNERSARTTIRTPWPEDDLLLLPSVPSGISHTSEHPVDDFLAGIDQQPTSSILTLRAKSAALFEASARISTLADSVSPHDSAHFLSERFQRILSSFLSTLNPLPLPNALSTSSFEKCSLVTSQSMAHAAVIRLNFTSSKRAYSPQALPSSYSETRPDQMIMDTLMSYERMIGNYPQPHVDAPCFNGQMKPIHASVLPQGHDSGSALGAFDMCMSSARQMLHIINSLSPSDYEFLEPSIACCWDLSRKVFIQEVERLGLVNSHLPDFQKLLSELGIIETALRHLGETFPIGKILADKLATELRRVINPAPHNP